LQPGGLGVGAVVNNGGVEVVNLGASASGTQVNSGGVQQVYSTGVASGTILNSGGQEVVFAGGVASATTLNGGTEGLMGSAFGTIINSGGHEYVSSGALDSGAHVNSGGFEIVNSGGTASAAIISGGTLEVMSGGSTGASAVTFAVSGGGILQLDHSQSFAGTVAGFGKPDFLDLRDIAFTSATTLAFTEAPGNTSGTLTVSDGTHTANITLLGQYVTAQFTKASDGAGGTLVGDPPLEEVMANKQTIGVDPHHT
jgi:autotransporter passenger strand-loop-strand repeat protein